MADFPTSSTSTVVVAPINESSFGDSERIGGDGRGNGGGGHQADSPQSAHEVPIKSGVLTDPSEDKDLVASSSLPEESQQPQAMRSRRSPPPQLPSTITATAQPQPQHPVAPLKRFTSVNINKRFLEKTPSTGASSGGSSLTGHPPGGASGLGQRRGASPASRSPSTDRPAPSRLVTAKLTAVPQPSTASTSGWLRTTPNNGASATPTPPSSSPQPPANAPATSHAQPTPTGAQPVKRRPGELPPQNGLSTLNTSSSSAQQANAKPAWGKISLPTNRREDGSNKQMNDFPTAAEAAHGRKSKIMNAQMPAVIPSTQTAAQKQAMNETAAAFRGAHLDPNAHHWDEMEDEDSDFLAGVIEFGDGTQYKIEQKAEATPHEQQPPAETANIQSPLSPPSSHSQVSKEERFAEDFDRSWPRRRSFSSHAAHSSFRPRDMLPEQGGPHLSPTDGSTSNSAHSPYEVPSPTSRVLFNERSNRLEPWSKAKPRLGPGQSSGPGTRRDGREDYLPSGSSRQQVQGRDAPPLSHYASSNVQLLQKGNADLSWKGGRFNHASERGRWGAPLSREEERSSEIRRRRESVSSSDVVGTSAREPSRDRDSHSRGDVVESMAPTIPQPFSWDRTRDTGRQLPPHLSRMPPPPVPSTRSRDVPPSKGISRPRPLPESPSTSVHSLRSPTSENIPFTVTGDGVDKDTLVKDAMQLAIERAKRRKQEVEEEERGRMEAAERARKKAEALAAAQEEKEKTKSSLSHQETEAEESQDTFYKLLHRSDPEGANKTGESTGPGLSKPHNETTHSKSVLSRPSGPPRAANIPQNLPRRPSVPPPAAQPTPASQADSWRSKVNPVPSSPPRVPTSSPPTHPQNSLAQISKGLELDLTLQPDENVEVVDFSDLGKLVGQSSPPAQESSSMDASALMSLRARISATNGFFDDRPTLRERPPQTVGDMLSWRRPASDATIELPAQPSTDELRTQTMPIYAPDEPIIKEANSTPSSPQSSRHVSQSEQASSNAISQSVNAPSAMLVTRSPRSTIHFKEAPMSTLTDTMSRIKGALDCMQLQDPSAVPQLKEKESYEHRPQSVALPGKARMAEMSSVSSRQHREPRVETSPQITKVSLSFVGRAPPREVFDITCPDLPRSPKPAWNAFAVRLPKVSHPRNAVSRKQLHFWNLPHPGIRWDILSWDPPVEGMNKRELSRDEIFHRKQGIKGGKLKVLLPNKRVAHPSLNMASPEHLGASSTPTLITPSGVRIKFPPRSMKEKSAVPSRDQPRGSDVPLWRKSAMPLTHSKNDRPTSANASISEHELNISSRSPPPGLSMLLPRLPSPNAGVGLSLGMANGHYATVSLPTNTSVKLKGSGINPSPATVVSFFRTSRGEPGLKTKGPLPSFTVTSELDRPTSSPRADLAKSEPNKLVEGLSAAKPSKASPGKLQTVESVVPSLVSSNSDGKSSDESASGTRPVTPPSTHTSSAWGKSPLSFSIKESPARSAPDPEHLKAVWSQPSGQATVTTSNSLKGIADDLPSIPFSVQDIKSEDGETPPPTAPAPPPSRLSLQEVTRAFQQVPGGPAPVASPSSRTSYAPAPLYSPAAQQVYRLNQVAMSVPPQHGVRPTFATYASPMVGHSPSPTLMYAPGISSPVAHPRVPNGPSPPIPHPVWIPTPPPQPTHAAAFLRAGPPTQMMYPPSTAGASSGAPTHMMDRHVSVVSPPGGVPPVPNTYPMDVPGHMHQTHVHAQPPHPTHAHPVAAMSHMPHIFSPPQHAQPPAMYAVPIGAGRGGMLSRPGYEGIPQISHLPHTPGYHPVPPTSFSHPFHS